MLPEFLQKAPTTRTPLMHGLYEDLTALSEHSLEDGLGREHRAVDLQNLLLVDEVLPPCLQDVVLQSAADRPEIVQTTHA